MPKKSKKVKIKNEAQIQAEFFKYTTALGATNRKYYWIYSNPYGVKAPIGVITQMKRQGSRDGVADVCCPFSNEHCSALYIEFKQPYKYQRPIQRSFQRDTIELGNGYYIANSAIEALNIVQKYMNSEEPHLYTATSTIRKKHKVKKALDGRRKNSKATT